MKRMYQFGDPRHVFARVHACVRACVRAACVSVCVPMCVRAHACVN